MVVVMVVVVMAVVMMVVTVVVLKRHSVRVILMHILPRIATLWQFGKLC